METATLVATVAALFVQHPQAEDDEIVEAAVAAGVDPSRAELAVALVPCAFGRAVIRENQWTAQLPDEFRVPDRRGRSVRYRLSQSVLYRAAAMLAEQQRLEDRASFAAVAARSAELNAIGNASAAGSDVRDGVFSPLFLARLPAEDIAQRRLRWWHRMRYE